MDQHILWGQGLRSPLLLAPKLSTSLQIKSWCLAAAIVALKVSLRIVGDLHNGIMEGLGVRQRTDTVRMELNSRLHSFGLDRSTHPAPAELPFRSAKNFSDTQACPKPNSPNPHPNFWPTWALLFLPDSDAIKRRLLLLRCLSCEKPSSDLSDLVQSLQSKDVCQYEFYISKSKWTELCNPKKQNQMHQILF